ncbi:SSI family serine proteinase inhibitor [Actinomadura hibisca]|uniref:SSI family serine proteinase inhibitor n=1 Tax=Actinomadura hibisca TaxID=68565 RepID=UPI0012F708ED|nr:SSI family serine proteinase inhibitor [Actinomadura hibisca]
MRSTPVLAGTIALLTALPAQATVAPPGAELNLKVTGQSKPDRGAFLACPGGLGNHPHGEQACADLATARGDFEALPGDPHGCTKEYAPVTAVATGAWYGRPVRWSRTYANACVMDAATGPVFRFWR